MEFSTEISTKKAAKARRQRARDSMKRREKEVEERMRMRTSKTTALSPFNIDKDINAISAEFFRNFCPPFLAKIS